ncbi:MAG TPA: cytochrome c peroxidase [Polyangiaceae bacterium]|nr:cytochrome c peroxidase [Polyangiaceae bacterium]
MRQLVFRALDRARVVLATLCCFALQSCGPRASTDRDHLLEESTSELNEDEPINPIPLDANVDAVRAALGEALFRDSTLSEDGKVACADCHFSDRGLSDGKSKSKLVDRPETLTNSTSLFNVRYLYRLTWAAKFEDLEAHLDALIKEPKVMRTSWQKASDRLARKGDWKERFAAAYPEGLTPKNVRAALLEYERSLVTPNAPFDRWLRGDEDAIGEQAKAGYALFKSFGCISCHQGTAVGGNLLQRFGVMRDYFSDRGNVQPGDLGRFNVTQHPEDRHVFRVPSLRNVALTAPYFHDGSAPTLDVAVKVMARYQLGRELSDDDVRAIVSFLGSLTGEYRGKPL